MSQPGAMALEALDFDSALFGFKVGRIEVTPESIAVAALCPSPTPSLPPSTTGPPAPEQPPPHAKMALMVELQRAQLQGIKLVYVLAPAKVRGLGVAHGGGSGGSGGDCSSSSRNSSGSSSDSSVGSASIGLYPGARVDLKTTYTAPLAALDKARLVTLAFTGTHARAVPHTRIPTPAPAPTPTPAPTSANEHTPSAPPPAASPASTDTASPALRALALAAGEWSRFRTDTGVPRSGFEQVRALADA